MSLWLTLDAKTTIRCISRVLSPSPLSLFLGFPPGSALLPGWGEAGGAGGTLGAGPHLGSILLGLRGGLLLGAGKRGGGVTLRLYSSQSTWRVPPLHLNYLSSPLEVINSELPCVCALPG